MDLFRIAGRLLALLPAVAAGGESLGRAIPDDSFFYLLRRANPERAFLDRRLAALGQAAGEARLFDLLVDLLVEGRKPEEQPALREEAEHWRRVLGGVAWGKLLEREYALGLRFAIEGDPARILEATPSLEWVLLFRVDPNERDAILATLRRLVGALGTLEVGLDPETGRGQRLKVAERDREGVPTFILSTLAGEAYLCVGGQGDVIACASSTWQLRRSLQRLRAEGSGRGIAESAEFARLFARLPAPEDGEICFRPALIFEALRQAARTVAAAQGPEELGDVEDVVRLLRAITDTFDLARSAALSETTDGRRLLGSFRIDLVDEAARRPLHAALVDRPPLGDVARLVPRGASAFAVWSGVDLERLHDAAVALVRQFPRGGLLIDEWRRLQEEAGLDLKADLLGPIEGRLVLLGFPPVEGTQGSPGRSFVGDGVALLRLRDPGRVAGKLRGWAAKFSEPLRAAGVPLEKVEIADVPGEFHGLAPRRPEGIELVLGTSGDELVAGTSRERIREALLVRSGKVEGIGADPRFREMDLQAGGEAQAAFYCDVRLLLVAAGGLAAVPWAAAAPDEDRKQLPQRVLTLAPRLLPLFRALGFADRLAGYLARDGNGYRGEVVLTIEPAEGAPSPTEKKRRSF